MKVEVRYDEFIAYCGATGQKQSLDLLRAFAVAKNRGKK